MRKNRPLIHSSHYMQWCTAGFLLIAFAVQIRGVDAVRGQLCKKRSALLSFLLGHFKDFCSEGLALRFLEFTTSNLHRVSEFCGIADFLFPNLGMPNADVSWTFFGVKTPSQNSVSLDICIGNGFLTSYMSNHQLFTIYIIKKAVRHKEIEMFRYFCFHVIVTKL